MGEVPLYQAEASRGGVSPVRPGEDSLLSSSSPLFSLWADSYERGTPVGVRDNPRDGPCLLLLVTS
jgi:hypothetical protein